MEGVGRRAVTSRKKYFRRLNLAYNVEQLSSDITNLQNSLANLYSSCSTQYKIDCLGLQPYYALLG